MFDIGFWEIFLILILALIIVGPERLPKAARTAGLWFGKARRYVEGVRDEVISEFDVSELKRMVHNQEEQINELQNQLNHKVGFDAEDELIDNEDEDVPEPEYDIIEEETKPVVDEQALDAEDSSDVSEDDSKSRE